MRKEQERKFQIQLEKIEREKCKADPDRKYMTKEANLFLRKIVSNYDQEFKDDNNAAQSNADENPLNYIIDWK